ncbi:MAG: hypothetical protein OEU50_16170 [Gammaproteobacteria bacterium]|nr:hypothetical protein [Gammaproteobacteria bacterium]
MTITYAVLLLNLATLIYFNVVATIIVFQETNSASVQKIARYLLVWLLPAIGAFITLRFSRQTCANELHEKLIPAIFGKWIYDETTYNPNRNRDDNDLKGIHGISSYDHGSRKK